MRSDQSFTLIELVIVIGILAVLAAVAVIVINPAEQMKSARDGQRIAELQTINKAIGLYLGDGKTSIGSTNTIYVSIPSSQSNCSDLGLPTLPAGWSYQCSNSSNYRKTDGNGWIPINFNSISFGNTMEVLPIDPVNSTSSLNYYTYVNGGSFELTAAMESAKYKLGGNNDKTSKDGGSYPELYETGSNLTLLPINYGDTSLVGYWKFDEGSGTTAYDASGRGGNGTLYNSPTYITGKVGNYALSFNGINNYVRIPNNSSLNLSSNMLTISLWAYIPTATSSVVYLFRKGDVGSGCPYASPYQFNISSNSSNFNFSIYNASCSSGGRTSSAPVISSSWNLLVGVYDGSTIKVYVNGIFSGQNSFSGNLYSTNQDVGVNSFIETNNYYNYLNGYLDDIRVYNRALSAAEVSALYNATNK